jgi:hypothetical protein
MLVTMTERSCGKTPARQVKPPAKAERVAREGAALRENLRKRKEQARARGATEEQKTPKG